MTNKWELIGKINASSYRKKILIILQDPKTPSQLEKETKIKFSHVSRALTELTENKLIECLTPNLRKNKIYKITNLGHKILKSLN